MKTILTSVLLFIAALSYGQDTIDYPEYVIEMMYQDSAELKRQEEIAILQALILEMRQNNTPIDTKTLLIAFSFKYDYSLDQLLDYVNWVCQVNGFLQRVTLDTLEQVLNGKSVFLPPLDDSIIINLMFDFRGIQTN